MGAVVDKKLKRLRRLWPDVEWSQFTESDNCAEYLGKVETRELLVQIDHNQRVDFWPVPDRVEWLRTGSHGGFG